MHHNLSFISVAAKMDSIGPNHLKKSIAHNLTKSV